MNKNYFLKKKIFAALKAFGLVSFRFVIRLYKLIFTKRTLLFVTNQKIRSITLGPISQFCMILCALWVVNLFNQSLRYNEILSTKAEEIDKLKSLNNYFQDEFTNVNDKLKKINEYLISVTGNTRKVKGEEPKFQLPKNIKEDELSRDDQHTLNEIRDASNALSDIRLIARNRIKSIENAINITGLNLNKGQAKKFKKKSRSDETEISLNNKKSLTRNQGGPLIPMDLITGNEINIANTSSEDEISRHLEKAEFLSDIDRLVMLEKLTRAMPLKRPMRNYYVSSGFGSRTDPITGRYAVHYGLDFAGPENERVISPSNGKVILAGEFSGYGNAIVIDHGFGITTRYGHLSKVKVREGQFVKRGEIIAIQGNTGRSTGSHLHYEVRYKNTPLNPKKFLEAGDTLFNDEKVTRYVNS